MSKALEVIKQMQTELFFLMIQLSSASSQVTQKSLSLQFSILLRSEKQANTTLNKTRNAAALNQLEADFSGLAMNTKCSSQLLSAS